MICGPQTGVFTFASDAGTSGVAQTNLAIRLGQGVYDGHFFGGRNAIPPETQESAWAAFATQEENERVFPAIGTADDALQVSRYQLKDYYHVHFEPGDVDFFVLDSTQMVVGNDQWDWFEEQSRAASGKWKIAIFHEPFVTSAPTGPEDATNDWGFADKGFDLVLNGGAITSEHIDACGIDVLNASNILAAGTSTGTLTGQTVGGRFIWGSPFAHFIRITATPWSLVAEFVALADGSTSHTVKNVKMGKQRQALCRMRLLLDDMEAREAAAEAALAACYEVDGTGADITGEKLDGSTIATCP